MRELVLNGWPVLLSAGFLVGAGLEWRRERRQWQAVIREARRGR